MLLNLFFATAVALMSCSKGDKTNQPSSGGKKRVVTGKIVDPSGNPLQGVKVYAGHDTYYNTNVIGVSNEKGEYELDLRGQPGGTWSIHGDVVKTYNNRTYRFRIDPDNSSPVTTTDGGVRNLAWKLTGVIPGYTDDSRIGGYITIMEEGVEYIPTEEIEFKLEPVGTLVDGSNGQTIIRRAESFPYDLTGLYNHEGLRDIPVGRYKITATHKPASGKVYKLKLAVRYNNTYAATITADFKQEAAYTFQEIDLNVKVEN